MSCNEYLMATQESPHSWHSRRNPAVKIEGIEQLCRKRVGGASKRQPFHQRRGLYWMSEDWADQAARDHRVGSSEI